MIEFTEDKLFLVIRSIKESKTSVTGMDEASVLLRHRMNIEADLLNSILRNGNIDFLIAKYDSIRAKNIIMKQTEKQNDENNPDK